MVGKQILESFVARIWLENGPGEDVILRGHIRQVKGTEESNFQGLQEMADFIQEMSGVQPLQDKGKEMDGDG